MAVLLEAVAASGARPLEVRWRYFSLSQVNSREDGWTVWDAPDVDVVRGRLAFRAAEAARRQDAFAALHMPLLRARHRDRENIDDRAVIDRVASGAGLDMARFARDVEDPSILDALARDHRHAAGDLGIFGTPTLVFGDGAAAYVRLREEVDAESAVAVFDRLVSIADGEPRILEVKRPVPPA